MFPDPPRQPLKATLSGTPGDRRRNRLRPPRCAHCSADDTRVTARTEYLLHLRCNGCGRVWRIAKPGHELLYGT